MLALNLSVHFSRGSKHKKKWAIVILNKLLVHYWVKLRSDWFIACNLTLVRWKFNCEKSLSAIFPNTRQLTDCFSWSFKIFFWNFQLGTSKWDGQKPFVRVKDKRCDTVQCETGIETTICKWLLTCLAISHHIVIFWNIDQIFLMSRIIKWFQSVLCVLCFEIETWN